MKRLSRGLLSLLPFLIVGALLYAAFFIKPTVSANQVSAPAIQRGEYMYGVVAPSDRVIVGVGSGGKTWRSVDAGKSWTPAQSPVSTTLQDISAWDQENVVAVGDGGTILVTQNGASTWQVATTPLTNISSKLIRVSTDKESTAWAVGEMGVALRSTDRGRTWLRMTKEEDKAWNSVYFSGAHVVLVGEFGRIAVSNDGGANWSYASSPVKSSLMAVAFRDEANGVAVGLDGVVLSTNDAGNHWQQAPKVSSEHLFDVTWNGDQWLAVGEASVLLRGDPTAAKWTASRVISGKRQWHTRIVPTGARLIAAGASVSLADVK